MRAVAARMDDAFGNSLVVEVENLLAEMEILESRRASRADLQRVLIVCNRSALSGRQDREVAFGNLMQFAAFAALEFLIVNCCNFFVCALQRLCHFLSPREGLEGISLLFKPRRQLLVPQASAYFANQSLESAPG